jgi:hypothetical protein
MADEEQQVERARKDFFDEFVKIKFLLETGGKTKKLNDKLGFINSIRRVLGL